MDTRIIDFPIVIAVVIKEPAEPAHFHSVAFRDEEDALGFINRRSVHWLAEANVPFETEFTSLLDEMIVERHGGEEVLTFAVDANTLAAKKKYDADGLYYKWGSKHKEYKLVARTFENQGQ